MAERSPILAGKMAGQVEVLVIAAAAVRRHPARVMPEGQVRVLLHIMQHQGAAAQVPSELPVVALRVVPAAPGRPTRFPALPYIMRVAAAVVGNPLLLPAAAVVMAAAAEALTGVPVERGLPEQAIPAAAVAVEPVIMVSEPPAVPV